MARILVALLSWLTLALAAIPASAVERPKILVSGLEPGQVAALRAGVPGARLVAVADEAQALREVGDAVAILGLASPGLVRAGKRLRWIQVYSAGVERYAFAELRTSKVVLTNAKVIQGPNVADHAMALLLALTRGIPQAAARQSLRRWAKQDLRDGGHLIELEGRTTVVVGLGGIGTAIARRAVGFGMTVVGVDPDTSPRPGLVETVLAPERLAEALPRADVLFLAVPLTPATERMIGATQLAALPRGSYLINVSRGRIVDTDALVRVLREGRLGGAGLDVTEPEPLPADHPLWAMPNVLVTPHLAGSSDRVTERRIELLRDNLARFLAGRPLRNVVDKDKGY